MASVAELKEKHAAATASVNSLRERLRQRREMLLDTDGEAAFPPPSTRRQQPSRGSGGNSRAFADCAVRARLFRAVARYSKAQGRAPVNFNPTDLVCCRTLQGHSGKVVDSVSHLHFGLSLFATFPSVFRFLVRNWDSEILLPSCCGCRIWKLESLVVPIPCYLRLSRHERKLVNTIASKMRGC
jgi:hypothetical protein